MRRRFATAVFVAVVLALVIAHTAHADDLDIVMGCGSLWPFCW